jgi:hypothetical protein
VNVTSSLERNYSRSAFLVAGVGVLTTGFGLDHVADAESHAGDTVAAAETATFTAALAAASAA